MRDIDQEAIRKDKAGWAALTRGGATLSRSLLSILWQAAVLYYTIQLL